MDNDEVKGRDNEITVFVNCKIRAEDGSLLGVVGVGIQVSDLKELLQEYEEKFQVEASLIAQNGQIEVSTSYTGYEEKDWFETYGQESIREKLINQNEDKEDLELWTSSSIQKEESYVVARYIPELSWYLIVEQDTAPLMKEMRQQIVQTALILIGVVCIVLFIITTVIRNFDKQIKKLMEERQENFHKATEQLYDNINELNLTKNCYVGKRTQEYFENLGAGGLPYDKGLRVIAEKQIKEEFREGYLKIFSPENVIREYDSGNRHLRYDFMTTQDGKSYYWIRIDAYIFYSSEDESIHMFTYRKNIDEEKKQERKAATDEMTGFLNKKATERAITELLLKKPNNRFAFFIFDIDNFKQANDQFGHAFGDFCIRHFTSIIKSNFREEDVLGRIGGDEFVAFIEARDEAWIKTRAEILSKALHCICQNTSYRWQMSASIGVSLFPRDGKDFSSLYQKADCALYKTKKNGKNGFTVYEKEESSSEMP